MMTHSVNQVSEQRFNRLYTALFFILFLLVPSYYQDNQGGSGLFLPFNNLVWMVTSFIIALGLLKILHSGRFIRPALSLPMLIFLVSTTLIGFINSVATPVEWLFRSLAIWGGVLFFFSVTQFNINRRNQERFLLLICASAALQSLYGLVQILFYPIPSWLPQIVDRPMGIFQQINLSASYAATGLLLSLYLCTVPASARRFWGNRLLLFTTIALTTSTIVTSGSRIGLLGVLFGALLLFVCRARLLWRYRITLAIALTIILGSGLLSTQLQTQTGGIQAGLSKFNTMLDQKNAPVVDGKRAPGSVRLMIYGSSLELFLEQPLLGHGIGQFQKVWHDKKITYRQEHPESDHLPMRLSHPHNELLYWAVEGGVAALAGILVLVAGFLWCCWRIGWQRGGAYIAILLPIALHSQVELPLYISQLHWVLIIFLIALVAGHRTRTLKLRISGALRTLGLVCVLAIPLISSIFFTHSLISAHKLTTYLMAKKERDIQALAYASNNLYFNKAANLMQMQLILQVALNTNDEALLRKYVPMAREYLEYTPDSAIFRGLIIALHKLKEYDASHRLLARLLAIYPTAPQALEMQEQIMRIDRELGIFDRYWKKQAEARQNP